MRVLLVTDWPFEGGGVESYVTQIAGGLRDAGNDVRLLTSSVGGGPDVADYVALGSRRALFQSVLQVANPAAASTVRRAIAEFRPDVLHVSMFEMHLSPSVLAAARNVPVVLNIAYYKPICPNGLKLRRDDSLCASPAGLVCWRGGCFPLGHWLRDQPRYARIRHEMRRAAAILTCSDWMRRQLAAAGVDSDWAPWPVAPPDSAFHRAPAQQPCFVFAGRLAREKGVETLLRAIAVAARQAGPIRLRVIGDGPQRPALERLTRELHLGDCVEFTGWLPASRVWEQHTDAWAAVVPSRWAEPLGLTAIEAIVRGVPVIASATGGLAETVEDDVSGMLFPNGDAGALAACLVEVATRRRLANGVPDETSRALRRRHDLARHVAWLHDIFRRVAA